MIVYSVLHDARPHESCVRHGGGCLAAAAATVAQGRTIAQGEAGGGRQTEKAERSSAQAGLRRLATAHTRGCFLAGA
jgi:hypothetical protein